MTFIDDKGVDNVRHYTYKGVDHSLLAKYVGQPYWNRVVTLLPQSLAPNMVTLIGFFAMVFQYALITHFCPRFGGEAPPFVYLTVAFCVFFYQTMDAIDGKQARRTKTSSPVGEIFDHGCDALSLILLSLSIFTVIQVGENIPWLLFALSCALFSFYTTLWEEFHSHVMYLGYVNVTEAQVLIISLNLIAYFNGPLWFANVLEVTDGVTVSYGDVAVWITISGAIFTGTRNIMTVTQRYLNQPSKLISAFSELIPLIQVLGGMLGWYLLYPDVLKRHAHPILIGYGTIHAALNGFLVVFRVSSQPFPLLHWWTLPTFAPFILYALSAPSLWVNSVPFVFGVYGVFIYVFLAQKVLRELAGIFGISIFSIPPGGYDFNKK